MRKLKHGIGYLNLPPVPQELLCPIEEIINMDSYYRGIEDKYNFSAKRIPPENNLFQWVKDVFKLTHPMAVQYQVITDNLPAHKDRNNRKLVFSYFLATGGNNVYTNIHDPTDLSVILERTAVKLHKWIYLRTEDMHSVSNIDTNAGPRVSLSITPNHIDCDNPQWWTRWENFIIDHMSNDI